jgi:hypothetical protein
MVFATILFRQLPRWVSLSIVILSLIFSATFLRAQSPSEVPIIPSRPAPLPLSGRPDHQRLPLVLQQLNFGEWPQFCDHSVTSTDVRLSVGPISAVPLAGDPTISASPRRGPVAYQSAKSAHTSGSRHPAKSDRLVTGYKSTLGNVCAVPPSSAQRLEQRSRIGIAICLRLYQVYHGLLIALLCI